MSNIVSGPWRQGGSSGGDGPDDPMLEIRVAALEERLGRIEIKIDRVDEALRRIEVALKDLASDNKDFRKQLADLTARVASIEGQVKGIPTGLQLFVALISTWAAGAAIVFALLKATHP